MEDVTRRLVVVVAAVVTAAAMAATEVLVWVGPTSTHHGVVARWYAAHAGPAGWRAGLLAVAAVGVVAFALSFRELTWAVIPERAWTGTLTVLAALGYAAVTTIAAAVELATVRSLVWEPSSGLIGMASGLHHALLVLATPAIVVVLLGATLPLVKRSALLWQVAAMVAVVTSLALAVPTTWVIGRRLVPLTLLFIAVAVMRLQPGTAAPTGRESSHPSDVLQDGDVP